MPRKPLPVGTWGTISRREAAPGRWRAATRFRDFDGRTRQVEAWGRSGAQAEAALRRSLIDRAAPSCDDVTADIRLDRLGMIWLEEVEAAGRLAPQTLDIYRRILESTVLPAVGGLRVREATTGRVDRFLKALAPTPAKARLARVVLGGLLGVAVRHDALSTNPVRGAARLPGSHRRPRALSLDELAALRDGVRRWQADPHQRGPKRAPDLLDVVDLLLATGARVGEVLAIRWSDVDLSAERPTLTVTGTVIQVRGEGLRRQGHPKTASGLRTIVLPRFAVDTLMRLRLAADGNPHDVVFPSSVGTLRSPNNFRRQWRSARAACGFEWVTPHTYRRTVATLLDRERGTKDAAAQLGHSATAVTERHYVERAAIAPDASDVLEALADASRAQDARESGG
jgi:integrase